MNLITVIPIARGIGKETLTYFSQEAPHAGSLVEISLRSKKAFGIVIDIHNAEDKKSAIKSLNFELKKINQIRSKDFLSPTFIDSVKAISDYYATTTGAVLSVLVPQQILEATDGISNFEHPLIEKNDVPKNKGEILALQSGDEERYGAYKSLIREEFARKHSIYLCLPNREEIRLAEDTLQKGIEQYTYVLHNGLSKKEVLSLWNEILANPHPILIIATGYFLSIPRQDLKTLIIENESSRSYVIPKRPFLDFRTVGSIFSKKMGWKVIFGDTALRVDTIFKEKINEIAGFSPLKFRVLSSANSLLIDSRIPKNQIKKEFEIIGNELTKVIDESKVENNNIFLFCARKGLYPLTVCSDCGETVSCENCSSPVVLYGSPAISEKVHKQGNFFLCTVCGKKRPADILCVRCGGWKLTPLGVGIESVEKELKKKFPERSILTMDKDHIKTHIQAEKITKKFYASPGSIMIGTEMALPYLKEKIGVTGVVSLDSFFSIPDFRIKEKIMNIILHLRSRAEKMIIIQTRRPTETVFDFALKGNLIDFYHEEIAEREKFGYPPFHTFIKITLEGTKVEIRAKMEKLRENLAPYDLSIFEGFHSHGKRSVVHGLLMIPHGQWPDKVLVDKFRTLSPQFLIKVDPDSLL